MEIIHELYNWVVNWSGHPMAVWILTGIAFLESSCFPIPPDVLQMAMSVLHPKLAIYYATMATIGSISGGVLGYFIGLKGGRPLLIKWISQHKMEMVENAFARWGGWAVAISAFTPIPYKVFTIAAGTFKVKLKTFVIASILGRGGRFFIVGILFYFFGEEISNFIHKYFNILSVGFIGLIIVGIFVLSRVKLKTSIKSGV